MTPDPERTARWAFAAVVVVLALAAAAWWGREAMQYSTVLLRTHDTVSGLLAGAPVELHGVEVGAVQRVVLQDPRTVDVVMRIRKDAPVTSATVATITTRGLAARGFTGYVYVALEDDGRDPRPLAEPADGRMPVLRSAPSRSVDLDTAVSEVREEVRAMSALLRALLDEPTVAALRTAAEDVQRVTRTLASNSDRLAAIMANTERATGLLDARTIASLRQSVAHLHAVTGTLASHGDRLATILVNADDATRRLQPLLQSGHEAVDSLQSQVLPEAYRALGSLERLSGVLDRTASRIDRDPSVLLRGKALPAPGPGEGR